MEQYGGDGHLDADVLSLTGQVGHGPFSEDLQPNISDFDFMPQAYLRRHFRADHQPDFRSQVKLYLPHKLAAQK